MHFHSRSCRRRGASLPGGSGILQCGPWQGAGDSDNIKLLYSGGVVRAVERRGRMRIAPEKDVRRAVPALRQAGLVEGRAKILVEESRPVHWRVRCCGVRVRARGPRLTPG